MKPSRGQALVEFALVTPLFLLLILGGLALGLLATSRIQAQHAVNETAIAVAQHPSGCSVASARAGQILGRSPDFISCSTGGQLVTVQFVVAFPQIAPFVPSDISVTGRAVIRDQPEATPSPSP